MMVHNVVQVVGSLGLIASNASAVAMAPFGASAGSAASLLGASQSLFGMLSSAVVGWISASGSVPMATMVAICAGLSFLSYAWLVKRERIPA